MSMTELGAGFTPRTRSTDFIEELRRNITDSVLSEVRAAILAAMPPAPVVHVDAPPPATVNIAAPDMPDMTCTVEMPGIDKLVTVLNDIRDLLRAPTQRDVRRDSEGQITAIVETRR